MRSSCKIQPIDRVLFYAFSVIFACACGPDDSPGVAGSSKPVPSRGTSGAAGTSPASTGAGGTAGTPGGAGENEITTDASAAGGSATSGGEDSGVGDAKDAGWPVGDPGTRGDGDFTIMPPYTAHPLIKVIAANPHGKIYRFTLPSQGTLFDGLDKTLATANQHTFTRDIRLYVPKQYVDGTAAPFMVVQDGDGYVTDVQNSLDNLIAAKKVPVMLAVLVNNGGGDGQDSERGLEYDTMSDRYSRFIDDDVLPAVLNDASIKADYPHLGFTDNPEGRSSYGCSSGGAAALTQGWFTPDKYRRIVTYSGTFVAQQDNQGVKAPEAAMYPLGAWEYHSDMELIANSPVKPLRVFLNASEHDNQLDAMFHDTYHEWLVANQRTAAALKAKGYHYRFVYALGVGHCDGSVRQATLPDTFEWMWQGYPIE
jgi:enterochelin esterase-like enzyme